MKDLIKVTLEEHIKTCLDNYHSCMAQQNFLEAQNAMDRVSILNVGYELLFKEDYATNYLLGELQNALQDFTLYERAITQNL